MNGIKGKLSLLGVAVSLVTFSISSAVSAHVVVRPAEAVTAGFQTFTIGVPNEKDIATTNVRLLIPDGLKSVTPTQKAGWQIAVEKEGNGEEAVTTSLTWSGGEVAAGFRDEFTFSAQVPEKVGELQWKAYQTYVDGTVVSWDKPSKGDGHISDEPNSGPFSVTKVVTETETAAAISKADQAAAGSRDAANRTLFIAIAGLVVGLVGVYLATRRK